LHGRRTVLIADDHTIIRDGLRALLGTCPDLEVVGEAGDGLEAVRQVERLQPDLVLMDVSMPRADGIEAIREIARRFPRTRTLALTMRRDEEAFLDVMRAGASGYVVKETSSPDLLAAIRKVLAGLSYVSADLSRPVIQGYLESRDRAGGASAWDSLTQRERQVLKLIAEGETNKGIADALCISPKTVDRHRTSLMQKLDLHSIAALTVYAVRKGLVP